MELELVLNELSLRIPADTLIAAQLRMSDLIGTLRTAITKGAARALRTQRDFNDLDLAPNYPVRRWRNDNSVDREEQRFFRSLTTKAPYLSDLPELERQNLGRDCHFAGQPAHGLGVALLVEGLAVSIRSEPSWDANSISVFVTQINAQGELVEQPQIVPHASRLAHINEHSEWFASRLAALRRQQQLAVRSGSDLWERRTALFPQLIFCVDVAEHLADLPAGAEFVQPLVKRLTEFDLYCRDWESGPFEPDALPSKVTPESPSTVAQFARERTFLCPDGIERLFSWHARLTPGAWRIHFYPETAQRKFIIGYIGAHLPTVRHRT